MGDRIATWRTTDGHHYVELVKKDGRYLLNTSLGPRYLDAHDFKDDIHAIRYVDPRVHEGWFNPPPLTWRKI
jgi:hypothetical protein